MNYVTAIAVCETNQATVFNDQIGMVEIHTNKKVHLPKFLLGTTHLYYVTDTGNIIFKTNYRPTIQVFLYVQYQMKFTLMWLQML